MFPGTRSHVSPHRLTSTTQPLCHCARVNHNIHKSIKEFLCPSWVLITVATRNNIPRAMTANVRHQISLGVVYDMCRSIACSASAGHRFSPNIYTDSCSRYSGPLQAFSGAHQAPSASGNRPHDARHHERFRRPWETGPVGVVPTACVVVVTAVVPPVIASRPIYRRVRVLDTQNHSTGLFRGHIKLKAILKIDYMKMKHATTSDYDDLRIPDFS